MVPLSPRTRGEIVLVATLDRRPRRELARARSASPPPPDRAGCPNTPVGARVYLGGDGWHAHQRARRAAARARHDRRRRQPAPRRRRRLAARATPAAARSRCGAARYDETPLDCGRAGCHPAITDAAAASPMTTVLARLMDAERHARPAIPAARSPATRPASPARTTAASPHVAAELGAAGQCSTARAGTRCRAICTGWAASAASPATARARFPRRRRAGASCAPTSAPSATTPRRATATSWPGAQSAMARADQDRARAQRRACARCHTTCGFPGGGRDARRAPVDRRAPDGVGPVGITCSACHAVHDPKRPRGAARLLRADAGAGAARGRARQNVCLPCHTPDADDARPSASAAAIWLGRGGLDPATGAPLTGGAAPRGDRRRLHRLPPRRPRQRRARRQPRLPRAGARLHAVPSAGRRRRRPTCARAPGSSGVALRTREHPAARARRRRRASIAARRAAARSGICCWCWRIRRRGGAQRALRAARCSTRRSRSSERPTGRTTTR